MAAATLGHTAVAGCCKKQAPLRPAGFRGTPCAAPSSARVLLRKSGQGRRAERLHAAVVPAALKAPWEGTTPARWESLGPRNEGSSRGAGRGRRRHCRRPGPPLLRSPPYAPDPQAGAGGRVRLARHRLWPHRRGGCVAGARARLQPRARPPRHRRRLLGPRARIHVACPPTALPRLPPLVPRLQWARLCSTPA